jgi:hypothetical protein
VIDNPIARGVVGFGLDVISDPLSYLSLGTLGAARAGGKSLTKAGLALKDEALVTTSKKLEQQLIQSGMNPVEAGMEAALQADREIHEAFKAADKYNKNKKIWTKDPLDHIALKKMVDAESVVSKALDPSKISDELFEPVKLRVGMNIPFLGHLQPEAAQQVVESVKGTDPGFVGQVFKAIRGTAKAAGKVIKPGKLDLGSYDLPETLVTAIPKINQQAGEIISAATKFTEALPVLGPVAKHTNKIISGTKNLLMETFAQSALHGKEFGNLTEELLNVRAANKSIATERTVESLGMDLLQDDDTMTDILLAIDGSASSVGTKIKELAANNKDLAKKLSDADDAMKRALARGEDGEFERILFKEALDQAAALGFDAETAFAGDLAAKMKDPNVNPKTKMGIERVMTTFKNLYDEEQAAGLAGGFIEHYIPHKYKNAPKGGSFLEKRKYETLGDAFWQSGKIPETNLPSLMRDRINGSLNMRSLNNYKTRILTEYGLPEDVVTQVYQSALAGDPAALNALKREGYRVPKIDLSEGLTPAMWQEVQRLSAAGDADAGNVLAQGLKSFKENIDLHMKAGGKFVPNNLQASALFNEIGEKVVHNGKEYFLPKQLAAAVNDIATNKDFIKATFNGPMSKPILEMMDSATAFMKQMVTLPFPAYHAQNVIGVGFRQLTQGLHGYNINHHLKTLDVLAGKTGVRSPGGVVYDPKLIQKVLKENGIAFSHRDMIGVVESAGKLNIDRLIANKRSLSNNLLSKSGTDKIVALHQASDALNRHSDGFMRTSHLIHRLEVGDTIPDAIKAANDLHFNYRNMSPVEQSLFRRFYTFYGFMSKATRAHLTDFVTNPGVITNQLAAVRGMAETLSDPDAAPTPELIDLGLLTSAVNAEQISHVVGKTPEGRPIIGRGFGAPLNSVMQQFSISTPRNLKVGELMSAAAESVGRTMQKQFATANPIINAAAEAITGKDLYFNKPLDAEFLRKLPSLNSLAERLTGVAHDDLPLDLDAPAREFLGAVPDGKGRLIATNVGAFWVLMNLVPGLARANSMAGTFSNTDIPFKTSLLRTLTNVNLTDTDVSRTALYDKKEEIDKVKRRYSVTQRLKNQEEGIE